MKQTTHKIGEHGAVGFITPQGHFCAECKEPIETTEEKEECKHSWIQDAPIKVCFHCGFKPDSHCTISHSGGEKSVKF